MYFLEIIPNRLSTIRTIKDVEEIKLIGRWLLTNTTNTSHVISAYATVRGSFMLRSLNA
jgi:hypothetical protein